MPTFIMLMRLSRAADCSLDGLKLLERKVWRQSRSTRLAPIKWRTKRFLGPDHYLDVFEAPDRPRRALTIQSRGKLGHELINGFPESRFG
jgi:hypothetical protein